MRTAEGFSSHVGYQDDSYFNALVRMALQIIVRLSASDRNPLIARDKVRTISHNFGYGVGVDMDFLFAKYLSSDHRQR